jgi:hypothetical protein
MDRTHARTHGARERESIMKSTTWAVLAGVTSIVTAAGAISIISGCNSGGSDPVSACTGYCEHAASCEGVNGSAIDNACKQSCADAGSLVIPCDGGSATTYFNCLGALPCSDFSADAALSAFQGCLQQMGCP